MDMDMDTNSTIFTKSSQLLGFADDLDLIGRNMDVVKEKFLALDNRGSDFGLKVNDTISPSNRQYWQSVTIKGHTFKVVDNFVYLITQVNSTNNVGDEIKRRVTLGNKSYFNLLKLLKSKAVTRNMK